MSATYSPILPEVIFNFYRLVGEFGGPITLPVAVGDGRRKRLSRNLAGKSSEIWLSRSITRPHTPH